MKGKVKVAQSCLTLCDPWDYTDHGILQARILEWVAVPFSRGSSQPGDGTQVSRIAGGFITSWTTREALGDWYMLFITQGRKCFLSYMNNVLWMGKTAISLQTSRKMFVATQVKQKTITDSAHLFRPSLFYLFTCSMKNFSPLEQLWKYSPFVRAYPILSKGALPSYYFKLGPPDKKPEASNTSP